MQRGNGDAQLVNSNSVKGRHLYGELVIADFYDTGNVSSGLADLNSFAQFVSLITQFFLDESSNGIVSSFSFNSSRIVAVCSVDRCCVILNGREIVHKVEILSVGFGGECAVFVLSAEAPHSHTESNVKLFVSLQLVFSHSEICLGISGVIRHNVVGDVLTKVYQSLVICSPESIALFGGEQIGCSFTSRSSDNAGERRHVSAVFFHTNDGQSRERSGSGVSRIAVYVDREQHVVDSQLFTIAELHALSDFDVVVNSAIVIDGLSYIGKTGISILCTVEYSLFPFDSLIDNVTFTIGGNKAYGCHSSNILIVSCGRKERAELTGKP